MSRMSDDRPASTGQGGLWARPFLRWVLTAFMVFAGVKHFQDPTPFESIVPQYLPAHRTLVLVSGFFEIAGGVSLLIPRLRPYAAVGLVALYIAVFPANVQMALHPDSSYSTTLKALLWVRLPLQIVLIRWAVWVGGSPPNSPRQQERGNGA